MQQAVDKQRTDADTPFVCGVASTLEDEIIRTGYRPARARRALLPIGRPLTPVRLHGYAPVHARPTESLDLGALQSQSRSLAGAGTGGATGSAPAGRHAHAGPVGGFLLRTVGRPFYILLAQSSSAARLHPPLLYWLRPANARPSRSPAERPARGARTV